MELSGNQNEGVERGEGSREDDKGKLSAILSALINLTVPNNNTHINNSNNISCSNNNINDDNNNNNNNIDDDYDYACYNYC